MNDRVYFNKKKAIKHFEITKKQKSKKHIINK